MERVSGDFFKDGSALAEVMSLYENIDQNNFTEDNSPEKVLVGQKSNRSAIKVQLVRDFLLLTFCRSVSGPCYRHIVS